MLERVAETVSNFSMFAPGQTVGVAVSGGADSVALLHALHLLAPDLELSLCVLHFDHRLRGSESDGDREFVAELAGRCGLPCRTAAADVARIARESGENLEQAARDARYGFFHRLLVDGTVNRVALGHTLSDQAETVLYRLLRGSGITGLAGIHPVTTGGFVRPLIDVPRPEIESWLRTKGHQWRDDSSNSDLVFDRNRVRHQLLPALEREWNPNLAEVLAHTAAVARDEDAFWEQETSRIARECLTQRGGAVVLDSSNLAQHGRAHQRRLIRHAIRKAKGSLRRIDYGHVEEVLSLASRSSGAGGVDLPGLRVRRSFHWLRFAPPGLWPSSASYCFPVSPPGSFAIPGANSIISLALEPSSTGNTPIAGRYNILGGSALDWSKISGPVELRNWRPGDRYQAPGQNQPGKLKEFFQSKRIPSWDRVNWPIIAKGSQVIWLRGFGAAEGYAPDAGCKTVLQVREETPAAAG